MELIPNKLYSRKEKQIVLGIGRTTDYWLTKKGILPPPDYRFGRKLEKWKGTTLIAALEKLRAHDNEQEV